MSSAGRPRRGWQARGVPPEVCHSTNLHRYFYSSSAATQEARQEARQGPSSQKGAPPAPEAPPSPSQAAPEARRLWGLDPEGRRALTRPPSAAGRPSPGHRRPLRG